MRFGEDIHRFQSRQIYAQTGDDCQHTRQYILDALELPQISREMIFSLSSPASRWTSSANSRLAGLFSGKISPTKMRKFQCIEYIPAAASTCL